jgi:hypothetical protein
VYETKIREGKTVYKVRLVADGRSHNTAGSTYSSTPSREEFYMMLHMIGTNDWDWVHVDESRAFLNADRIDPIRLYARLRGDEDEFFQILRALYGLKTSTRDHAISAAIRLASMGFRRKGLCTNIFEKTEEVEGKWKTIIVYQYVDDYFFTGNDRSHVEELITRFRGAVQTSSPIWKVWVWNSKEIESYELSASLW